MKIGIIGTRGIPNYYGGFEQFAQYLSAGLAEKGHAVFVYNSSLHPYKEKSLGKVTIIHCKDPEDKLGAAGQFLYDLNCINDSRKRGFDVLLHLGYTSDSVWHRRWPARTTHLVNMDGLEWKRSKYNPLTRRFLKWAEALAAKHADMLIADSPGIKEYLHSTYKKEAAYIPYGATPFNDPDPSVLREFNLLTGSYHLIIARMEPENNIETIIKGYLASGSNEPLFIIGNCANPYGRYLLSKYSSNKIIFAGAIYEMKMLNNLRYHSRLYFHGHSVGGTNPSLLEAMACGCRIAAHDNPFNKSILQQDADYFSCEDHIAAIITAGSNEDTLSSRKMANLEKISTLYNWDKVIAAYEALMLAATGSR